MKITLIALIAALQLLEIIYYERIGERKTLKVKMIDALFSALIIFNNLSSNSSVICSIEPITFNASSKLPSIRSISTICSRLLL